jgi:predicted methyltransferase
MSRSWIIAAALATALGSVAAVQATPSYVTAALGDAARPDKEKALDEERKPAEMIAFAGIKPGSRVMDLVPGGGYFTHIFAKVVGDKGYVYAYTPTELDPIIQKQKPGADPTKQFADYANVTVLHQPIDKLTAPESLDVVWTAQNYHDLHDKFMGPADLAVVNKAIFDALKPGGVYVIVDHSAKDGTGLAATDTIHRIDEAVVKQEVEAAGFKLAAESNVLRNPADPRDKLVFDPSIRHHTDQFILKFVKPRH